MNAQHYKGAMEELYKQHRPSTLKEIVGQEDAVRVIRNAFKKGKLPHSLLLTGDSGVGKTTIARIIANMLECDPNDFFEYNAADFNGIDSIREIRSRMGYSGLSKKKTRVYMLDECFPQGTQVNTPVGFKSIESFSAGDRVVNCQGTSTVRHLFKNRVALNRVVKIKFTDGSIVFSTAEHEFLTTDGWVPAINLPDGYCILAKPRYPMCKEAPDANSDLQVLQGEFPTKVEKQTGLLFQELCPTTTQHKIRAWENGKEKMQILQNEVSRQEGQKKEDLQSIVFTQTADAQPYIQGETAQQGRTQQNQYGSRGEEETRILTADEGQEPDAHVRSQGESNCHQREERKSSHLERETRRERDIYAGATDTSASSRFQMETGTDDHNEVKATLVQRGSRAEEVQNRNRGRREFPQVESRYIQRQAEESNSRRLGVESVEVYQQGHNDENFKGVIEDQERRQGYATFFDLEIQGHPSYFVDGIPVHNCQMLSRPAQNAMLKILEDTPNHVYFFLCTSEPQKVIAAIKTRCTTLSLRLIPAKEIKQLVQDAAKKFKIKIRSDQVLNCLTNAAEGSARKALVLLEMLQEVKSEENQLSIIEKNDAQAPAIMIARALYDRRTRWPDMAKILKDTITEDPEKMRHMILSYFTAILCSGKQDTRAAAIIEEFTSNLFDGKRPEFVLRCFNVIVPPK